SSENGGKSESVANLQAQPSLNSIHSSPGPKRSTNTLKKWLTSPVRRLNSGKADGNIKKQKKVRDGRKSFDLGSPKPGDETTPQGDSADEAGRNKIAVLSGKFSLSCKKSKKGWGEDEPDEESHTPLPPPMKIFDNDPTQDEMSSSLLAARQASTDVPTAADLVSAIEKLVKSKLCSFLTWGRPSTMLIHLGPSISPTFGFSDSILETTHSLPLWKLEARSGSAIAGRILVDQRITLTFNNLDHAKDISCISEGFMKRIEEKGAPEDMRGKDKIVFGNIHQIYDWHKDFFLAELEKCIQEQDRLAQLFIKHERKLHIYVWYCQNKPRSEYIVAEYDAYFEEVKQDINQRLTLSDFLIKPIQRITKYQLLLKDFLRYSEKAGLECSDIEKAVELMCLVPKRCNDMMNLGRLQGFEGTLTAQGKLLQQDTFYVIELDAGMQSRTKERRVFLFEQIVIFSELLRKGSLTPGYMFKRSIKMNYLVLEENVDNDPCKFALMNRETSERVILQAANADIQQAWVQDINQVLETQRDFLNGLYCGWFLPRLFSGAWRVKGGYGFKLGPSAESGNSKVPLSRNGTWSESSGVLSHSKKSKIKHRQRSPEKILSLSTKNKPCQKMHSLPDPKTSIMQTEAVVSPSQSFPPEASKRKEASPYALQSPIEYQRKERSTAVMRSQPARAPQASPRPYSSVPMGSEKPPKGSSYNPPLPPLKISTSNGSPGFDYHQPGDKHEASKVSDNPLFPPSPPGEHSLRGHRLSSHLKKSSYPGVDSREKATEAAALILMSSEDYGSPTPIGSWNDLGGCNGTSSMAVIKDYYALKENEICVSQGEVVQVLAVNQQNMCLVYQPASDHSPAAEGWVPGNILAPLTKATAAAENSDGSIKKSCSWHTLRMRKRAEVENTGKNEATGPRKPKDILGNKVSVKILNPNFIQEVAPEFLVPLVDVTCLLGDTVTLQCKVCGRPKPTITWKGPDQNILDTNNSSATYSVSSCDSGEITLKICNLMPQDSGIYTCIATNDHGTTSTSATVKVQDAAADGATISWKDNFDSAYTELNEIGRGRFSIVKKCIHKATRKDVAVKFVSKKMKKKEQAAHEAALLQHLQHPQYITLHDTYESPTSYILILELMDDGRLLDYLMNHDELMEEKVAFYIRDIMEALQYLHSCRVAHLDIKPENLLIDLRIPVPRVKLIDLEDAVQISGHFHIHHLLGNPEFAAPEVIQGIPVSLGTDIWSIGVLTYVMLSGVSPFLDESKEETCINVCRVDFSFPHEYFCGVSNAARDFINVILQEDFRRRPTAATCLQHPWLQPHNGSYSKIPLDTSRLACFIERRKHQNDVRPVPNVKSYIVNRVNQGT
uniref:Kalirin RhoGEF kinase n=1 Tax=Loxodonta africana TaxID=9785 RepID=G3TSK0_LOXAF